MPHPDSPYFAYHTNAWSYVERAQTQLQLFDAGNPANLFYAAFELRTGIEARLYDGLKNILQYKLTEEERKKHAKRIEKFNVDKLFMKLKTIDENTLRSYTVMIGSPSSQSTTLLQYTAVTKQLTNDREQLGKLLHHRFFIDNQEWYHKKKIYPNKDNMKSLMDYRDMLSDIAKRLEEASRGDLLTPPPFLIKLVEELDEDTE